MSDDRTITKPARSMWDGIPRRFVLFDGKGRPLRIVEPTGLRNDHTVVLGDDDAAVPLSTLREGGYGTLRLIVLEADGHEADILRQIEAADREREAEQAEAARKQAEAAEAARRAREEELEREPAIAEGTLLVAMLAGDWDDGGDTLIGLLRVKRAFKRGSTVERYKTGVDCKGAEAFAAWLIGEGLVEAVPFLEMRLDGGRYRLDDVQISAPESSEP